ncbi:hypothetical protein J5N97_020968 [Dioscorea zingiberensis]|uniref:Response regulatory domain-containing protein n=1 Tax=Dioscorea zingiberensis TaxID=325984 RepID=A0A9D5HDW3_9LILI|nr:hypothetical protein J5N97_020968 [Dioscorea zingiberensis]
MVVVQKEESHMGTSSSFPHSPRHSTKPVRSRLNPKLAMGVRCRHRHGHAWRCRRRAGRRNGGILSPPVETPPLGGPRDHKSSNMSSPRPRILLVEDAEINRVVVRRMARELNVGLEEAENGEVAVELLRRGECFDLILMDKDMPVMDGHEAARQMRSLGVRTPIVALSGNGLPSDRDLFFQAGADEFQVKCSLSQRHNWLDFLPGLDLMETALDQGFGTVFVRFLMKLKL